MPLPCLNRTNLQLNNEQGVYLPISAADKSPTTASIRANNMSINEASGLRT